MIKFNKNTRTKNNPFHSYAYYAIKNPFRNIFMVCLLCIPHRVYSFIISGGRLLLPTTLELFSFFLFRSLHSPFKDYKRGYLVC